MLSKNITFLDNNNLQSICNNRAVVVLLNSNESELTTTVSNSKFLVAVAMLVVVCLHIIALLAMLNTSSVVSKKVSLPTIVGVLIQNPATELKETSKNKTIVKPISKKSPPSPKKIPSSDKAITLPEPVVKEPLVTDVKEVVELLDIPPRVQKAPIVSPRSDASHLNNRAPVYPRASLRRHEEGKVILELLVRADGTVGSVRVKGSSGHQRLDNAALKAVRHWRYVPARQNNEAIDFWYQQPLVFSLRK